MAVRNFVYMEPMTVRHEDDPLIGKSVAVVSFEDRDAYRDVKKTLQYRADMGVVYIFTEERVIGREIITKDVVPGKSTIAPKDVAAFEGRV